MTAILLNGLSEIHKNVRHAQKKYLNVYTN